MAERFRVREGHYPSRILADKIYRNRENLSYCKAHGIRLSGPALGRPKKGETRDKAQDYRDECERVEVERRFSLAKRKCGMGLVTAKLQETAAHVIAMSVLVLNLRKIQHALLRMLAYLLEILAQNKNWALVQWTSNRQDASGKWCCVDSLSVVSDPDVRKIPLPTEKNWSFCGAEREMDWIVALRGSADIIRGQVSAALTAAANVNTANSQHEFPCGQLAVGGHGCFCPRQPPRQLQPYLLLRIAQKPVVANLQHTGC